MERELIDADPLCESFFKIGCNYKTTKHKLKICTPKFPIHDQGDFILLGGKELINLNAGNDSDDISSFFSKNTFGDDLEVYVKREWMIDWCEEAIKKGLGWYMLREIAPLLLRELKSGNSYFYFFDLVKESGIDSLNAHLECYNLPTDYKSNLEEHLFDIDAKTVERQEYTGGTLCENVLIENSIKVRKAIFGNLLMKGKVVMLHRPKDRLELIEEVDYFGSGIQVGPLAGSGGIHFMYNDNGIYYHQTWIS